MSSTNRGLGSGDLGRSLDSSTLDVNGNLSFSNGDLSSGYLEMSLDCSTLDVNGNALQLV